MYVASNERASLPQLLTRTADNSSFYAALTGADRISDIGERADYSAPPGYRLVRVDHRMHEGNSNEFEIALLDDAEGSVAFYAKATLLSIPEVSERKVARHQIWRSTSMRHSLALREISRAVLFGYILRHYDLLLAEDAVTGDGKFYWHRQVSRAIALGFHVYAYDLATQALRSISTQCELNDVHDLTWSITSPVPLHALISTYSLVSQ